MLDQKIIDSFRELFLEWKKDQLLLEKIAKHETTGGDEIDLASEEQERLLHLKLHGRTNFLLKKIDQALVRIEEGKFGICSECDGTIEITRLSARPTATECISCKEELERQENHIPYQRRSHTHGKSFTLAIAD